MAPKLGDRPVDRIEQGETAKAAFNAVNRTIDSMECSSLNGADTMLCNLYII